MTGSEALEEGLRRHVLQEQQEDGSFISRSSPDPGDFSGASEYACTFPAAIILQALAEDRTTDVLAMKRKAAEYLSAERNEHGSINYWKRGSEQAVKLRVPDDLDATFCALGGILLDDPARLGGGDLAKAAILLTATEVQEGGPYRTWLVPSDAPEIWRDVDPAVNANVAFFLRLNDVSLDGLNAFLETCIASDMYTSPYYPSYHTVAYFIARAHRGPMQGRLREYLFSKRDRDGGWGNPIETALCLSALIEAGGTREDVTPVLERLERFTPEEMCTAYAFCIDPAIGGKRYFCGSSALTAALCLEALMRAGRLSTDRAVAAEPSEDPSVQVVRRRIWEHVNGDIDPATAERIRGVDGRGNISLLPLRFRDALGDRGAQVSDALVEELGAANLCGWAAYTVYDDILDGEGDPQAVPAADLCLKKAMDIFTSVLPQTPFTAISKDVIVRIDAANAWEASVCRAKIAEGVLQIPPLPDYGDYGMLADRSFGHALGPLAVLLAAGFSAESKEIREVTAFFRQYIIARQLDDDAHDWEDDLLSGSLTPPVCALLRRRVDTGSTGIPLDGSLSELQKVFWLEVAPEICQEILKQTKQARESIARLNGLVHVDFTERLLGPIEASARKGLSERDAAMKFLQAYGT